MAFANCNGSIRVRVYRQTGTPVDLGGWYVAIVHPPWEPVHVARHTSKASALRHAKVLRAVLRHNGCGLKTKEKRK